MGTKKMVDSLRKLGIEVDYYESQGTALFNLFSLHSLWGWLFLLAAPLLVKQARYVMREMDPVAMRPMLERTVKGALLTNLLFVLGIFLSQWAA